MSADFDVVTGAFSYSGAAIARELQAAGRRVRTLTGHPGRAPAGTASRPGHWISPIGRADGIAARRPGPGYNTYWVRFAHGTVSHPTAVAHSRVLLRAAAEAGVRPGGARVDHATAARLLGLALRDTLLTAEEYQAMADGLADTDGPATGDTALTEWITTHNDNLGRVYANELTRHFS